MPDAGIFELPAASALTGTEVTAVVQGGTTKKATLAQVLALNSVAVTVIAAGGAVQTLTAPTIAGAPANGYDITLTQNMVLQFTGGVAGTVCQIVFYIRPGTPPAGNGPYEVILGSNVNTINVANPIKLPLTATSGNYDQFIAETKDGANFTVTPVATNTKQLSAPSAGAPDAPNIAVYPGTGQLTIHFADGKANGGAVTGHKIYRGTTSGGETPLTTYTGPSPYVDPTAVNGTTYFVQVAATNLAGGDSAMSNEASAVVGIPAHALLLPSSPVITQSSATTPSTATNTNFGTNDAEYISRIFPASYTSNQQKMILGLWSEVSQSNTNTIFAIYLAATTGILKYSWRDTSGATNTASSSVAPQSQSGVSTLAPLWIRVVHAHSAGTVTFYTGGNGDTPTWTQLGTVATGQPTTAKPTTCTTPLSAGNAGLISSGTVNCFPGQIMRSTLKIAGTTVNDIDWTAFATGQTSGLADLVSGTCTLNGSAGIK